MTFSEALNQIKKHIVDGGELFFCGAMEGSEVKDARGKPVEGFAAMERVTLWFVDQKPSANWGHDCLYVASSLHTLYLLVVPHNLPPHEEIEMREVIL